MNNQGPATAAMLWDESFLWGLMAYRALEAEGLSCELVRSADISSGCLRNYRMLFVPGGWASNKLKALGEDGVNAIREFVGNGGSYVGFCGGAGLATMDGLGLVNITRRPTRDRVPSFSGRIRLNITEHPVWGGRESRIHAEPVFYAWWPSQFVVQDASLKVLATYDAALRDSFSSDLNVGDAERAGIWSELERTYRINLDPRRLSGEPAVIEGAFGKGSVLLSLLHFDTPGDANGAAVLRNLWNHLGIDRKNSQPASRTQGNDPAASPAIEKIALSIESSVADLIDLGLRNFLWFWRNPLLLQWRRGVRGLEYGTLYVMVREIAAGAREGVLNDQEAALSGIRDLVLAFADKARDLLLRERYAMQNGHITYEKCDDPDIQRIREELFSRSKSYGGTFKVLLDGIDRVVYKRLETRLRMM